MVLKRVRNLGRRPHTPTQFFWMYPLPSPLPPLHEPAPYVSTRVIRRREQNRACIVQATKSRSPDSYTNYYQMKTIFFSYELSLILPNSPVFTFSMNSLLSLSLFSLSLFSLLSLSLFSLSFFTIAEVNQGYTKE